MVMLIKLNTLEKTNTMIKHILALLLLANLTVLKAQQDFIYPSVLVTNEEKINSKALEFSPAFYEDGIIFISTIPTSLDKVGFDPKINKPTMSIFIARRNATNGELKAPTLFAEELTTKMHEGPLTFDRNAEKVYYTRNDIKRKKKGAKLKIYESIKTDGHWSSPKELPFNLDDYETAHPTISADGNTLIFSSNRPGGIGGMDLYVSRLEGDTWSEPQNLGDKINTPKNEIFPFLHADHTLFFSSNGHIGEGGLDLFYSILDKSEEYSPPINLGPPFNSSKDDFGIILDRDKKNGYVSSNRDGGAGEDDIYSFSVKNGNLEEYFYFENRVPNVLETTSITVLNKDNGSPLANADILLIPLNPSLDGSMLRRNTDGKIVLRQKNGETNNLAKLLEMPGRQATTDANGSLSINLPVGYYAIVSKKKGFSNGYTIVNSKHPNQVLFTTQSTDCITVHGTVQDERNKAPLSDILIKLIDQNGQLVSSTKTNDAGQFEACVNCNQVYQFQVFMQGKNIGGIDDFDTHGTDCNTQHGFTVIIPVGNISLALEEGAIIELKNLYFNFNDPSIRPDVHQDLDALVAILQQYPDMEIEIASYTDAVGSKDYNNNISQKRAFNVSQYLENQGIDANRLTAIGYGESGIRNRCIDGVKCSDSEHQYNRRVEIKIIKSSVPVKVNYSDPSFTYSGNTSSNAPISNPANDYQSSSESSLPYRVVIGAYLVSKNAERKVQMANKLGLEGLYITSFEDSPAYFSVVAKDFANKNEAVQFAKHLKADYGLKYYVKKVD